MKVENKALNSVIKYYVDKEKGIVVAKVIIASFLFELLEELTDRYNLYSPVRGRIYTLFKDKTIIVTAKLSPEDTWNEEYGKKIAFNKAKKELKNYVNILNEVGLKNAIRLAEELGRIGAGTFSSYDIDNFN